MRADGSSQVRITRSPGWDFAFSWSRRGGIAFNSDRDGAGPPPGPLPLRTFDVYTMEADGSDVTRLTHDTSANDAAPAFSPDGKRIAFTSDRAGDLEVYVMRADGSNQRRVTDQPGEARHPAWSPNGNCIVFDSDADGDFDVYATDLAGSGLERVTSDDAYDFYARPRPMRRR